jgi:hypothetical protein
MKTIYYVIGIAVLITLLTGFYLQWYISLFEWEGVKLSFEEQKSDACNEFIANGCENSDEIIVQYDVDKNGVTGDIGDTLQALSENNYGCENINCTRRLCACP